MSSPKLQALMLDLLAEGRISINESRSINLEIEGASTPPEGYVLVPEEPTVEVLTAMSRAIGLEPLPPPGDEDGGYPITGSASTVRQCYAAMLAARPEVSGG